MRFCNIQRQNNTAEMKMKFIFKKLEGLVFRLTNNLGTKSSGPCIRDYTVGRGIPHRKGET